MAYNRYPGMDEFYKFPPEVRTAIANSAELIAKFAAKSLETTVGSHIGDGSNPHDTTKAQVGLGSADNTSDLNKPVSTAAAALFVPRWKASTAYVLNQQIVAPTNEVVSAKTAHTSAATYDATKWNSAYPPEGRGMVEQEVWTNIQGPYSTSITVVGTIASVTFKAGRKYRLEFNFEYAGSTAGNYAAIDINTASTLDAAAAVSNMTKRGGASVRIHDANMGTAQQAVAFLNPTVDATYQLKVTAFVWSGSGTVSLQSSAVNPRTLTVYDEGDQI